MRVFGGLELMRNSNDMAARSLHDGVRLATSRANALLERGFKLSL